MPDKYGLDEFDIQARIVDDESGLVAEILGDALDADPYLVGEMIPGRGTVVVDTDPSTPTWVVESRLDFPDSVEGFYVAEVISESLPNGMKVFLSRGDWAEYYVVSGV